MSNLVYGMVQPGELIKHGDEFRAGKVWVPALQCVGSTRRASCGWIYRRLITRPKLEKGARP